MLVCLIVVAISIVANDHDRYDSASYSAKTPLMYRRCVVGWGITHLELGLRWEAKRSLMLTGKLVKMTHWFYLVFGIWFFLEYLQ